MALAKPIQLQTVARQPQVAKTAAGWTLDVLAGRVTEVTGFGASARTSWLAALVAQAQRAGETVVWLQLADGPLFPPDLAQLGVDVGQLTVGCLPDAMALLRAADVLLRSGAFGLCVVDWDEACSSAMGSARRPTDGQLGRLLGLAQKNDAALVFLTRAGGNPSSERCSIDPQQRGPDLGSLVSLRLEVKRERRPDGLFSVVVQALKDKRHGPGRRIEEIWHGPQGMS